MKTKCPFCGEIMTVNPSVDGGYTLGCCCACQGPERPTKRAAARDAIVFAVWGLMSVEDMRTMIGGLK